MDFSLCSDFRGGLNMMWRVLLWTTVPIVLAFLTAYLGRTSVNSTLIQCNALSLALSGTVSFPASSTYSSSSSSYWSKQEESLAPSCVVSPTTVDDVVTTIKTLTLLSKTGVLGCQFAIRGGGHTPWAGSANINGGVTIDMRSIDDVTINAERSIASVGAGAIWGDVYREMDAKNLTVVGGRGSSIGVGGLLTGGKCWIDVLIWYWYELQAEYHISPPVMASPVTTWSITK